MKGLLAVFLAFYILGLTLVPCVDKEMNCQIKEQIQTSSSASDSHESHSDFCSPFCHCSCCNLSMEVGAPLIIASVAPPLQILTFSGISGIFSDFTFPVWEPPKA
ncbi:MAG: DUF6660 family protein [bacterium]